VPEQEPEASSQGEPAEEQEPEELSYSVNDLVEAMVIAADLPGVRGPDEAATARRFELVGKTRELLDRYRIGVEPDFEYIAEAIDFVWEEARRPDLIGLPPDEATKRRGELEASRAQREAEFVKKAYGRLVERKQPGGG